MFSTGKNAPPCRAGGVPCKDGQNRRAVAGQNKGLVYLTNFTSMKVLSAVAAWFQSARPADLDQFPALWKNLSRPSLVFKLKFGNNQ